MTGKRRPLDATIKRAVKALQKAEIPFAVVGATALTVQGLERMTRDLDVVIFIDDAREAFDALSNAGLNCESKFSSEDPDPMYVFTDPKTDLDVDLLVAAGQPEATIIDEAKPKMVFGIEAPVASFEHLLLMYLYSNQPKHLGDFARIIQEANPDLTKVERLLADIHPEMMATFKARVESARNPAPAPAKPPLRTPRKKPQ